MKLRSLKNGTTGEYEGYMFWCQGCNEPHRVKGWEFNNDMEKPTFSPSILVTLTSPSGIRRCHSYITDGKIKFLSDCSHEFAGAEVELIDIDIWPWY